jgi:hypothetical protein
LFSDKTCAFPDTRDVNADWIRWYKRAIADSARQLFGAERWINEHSDRVFLDRKCSERLPVAIPDAANRRIHRVIVAHGAKYRCRATLGGGSGSLMISPDIVGDDHVNASADGFTPFAVGDIDPTRGFVHVLDDVSLEIVLGELDTITDFVSYISYKEKFIRAGRLGFAAGEEDLLSHYLTTMVGEHNHGFRLPDGYEALYVGEGHWAELQQSPEYQRKKCANRISYL